MTNDERYAALRRMTIESGNVALASAYSMNHMKFLASAHDYKNHCADAGVTAEDAFDGMCDRLADHYRKPGETP